MRVRIRTMIVAGVLACALSRQAVAQEISSFRLHSGPVPARAGDQLMLCATNVGTTPVSAALDFLDAMTGVVVLHRDAALGVPGPGSRAGACLTKVIPTGSAGPSTAIIAILIGRVTVSGGGLAGNLIAGNVIGSVNLVQGNLIGSNQGGGIGEGGGLGGGLYVPLAPLPCLNPCCGN